MFPGMDYFHQLKEKINNRLDELARNGSISDGLARKQKSYTWLYGAIGKVPTDIMFICENPSLKGIENAQAMAEKLGNEYDIEAQWWGGNAGTVFRPALCELGLKTSPPDAIGGWECYITNVIKQANYANVHGRLTNSQKKEKAKQWADILRWEIEKVNPRKVICVGGSAFKLVKYLSEGNIIQKKEINQVIHYSAHFLSHEEIKNRIIQTIRNIL